MYQKRARYYHLKMNTQLIDCEIPKWKECTSEMINPKYSDLGCVIPYD